MDNLYIESWQELNFVTSTSNHYDIYYSAIRIVLILWIIVLLVFLIRCITAVDFQLVHVRILAFVPSEGKNNELKNTILLSKEVK